MLAAFQRVEDELSSLRILADQYQAQAAAVASATEEVAITLNEYEAGTIAYTAVVVFQATQLADQELLLIIQQDRLLASVSLVKISAAAGPRASFPPPTRCSSRARSCRIRSLGRRLHQVRKTLTEFLHLRRHHRTGNSR